MNTGTLRHVRHKVALFVVAAALALLAAAAPTLLDNLAGTNLTTPTYACQPTGGVCPG